MEIKVSVVDLDQDAPKIESISRMTQQLTYNAAWERDLIMRISKHLATIAAETSLIFGIFSRGQRSVTKEDFKYCALTRLRMTDVSEKEMDFFFNGNDYL